MDFPHQTAPMSGVLNKEMLHQRIFYIGQWLLFDNLNKSCIADFYL